MIKVQLNNIEVELKALDKRVTFDSIKRCLAENMPIILSVVINHQNINIVLSGKDYPSGNGSYRKPNALELSIFDAWERLSLNCSRINPHNLFKFLDEIKHLSS